MREDLIFFSRYQKYEVKLLQCWKLKFEGSELTINLANLVPQNIRLTTTSVYLNKVGLFWSDGCLPRPVPVVEYSLLPLKANSAAPEVLRGCS